MVGVRGALEDAPPEWEILIFSDLQAAVRKTGRTGKARTAGLGGVILGVKKRQEDLGLDAVQLGWMKAHVGINGNEEADKLEAGGEQHYHDNPRITEGGRKQE